ncbi:MAG: GTP 3',8-cyclase MoaA, partial [Desulfatiglandales bacterium]
VRFIEFMPVSNGISWSRERVVGHREIFERLSSEFGPLEELPHENLGGPARCFRLRGAKGIVGLISPVTHNFCESCNRIRITARGGLKTCLFSASEIPIIQLLRSGLSDHEIRSVLEEAIREKKRAKKEAASHGMRISSDYMSQIGG